MPIIRVIDYETDGVEAGAPVIEEGFCDLDTVTFAVGRPFGSLRRVHSTRPEARAIHHIRAEDTIGFPPYDRRCLFEDAVSAGAVAWAAHNADHEAKYLIGHLPLICTYKAALRVFPDAPGHSVFALLYWLEDQGLVDFDHALAQPAHRAPADAYATAHVLAAMLRAGTTGKDLFAFTEQPKKLPTCPIGAHRGKKWPDVEHSFLVWILSKPDMDSDIQWNAATELDRREREMR